MTGRAGQLGQGALSPASLAAANIHPATGLATDYLNHFNEVVMLMEMLPDMPDCVEDVLAWQPASYVEHFERSGFAARELAIAAYAASPRAVRSHLETVILQIDAEVVRAQGLIVEDGEPASLQQVARLAGEEIRPLISAASAAIHGRVDGAEPDDEAAAQSGIDALFD